MPLPINTRDRVGGAGVASSAGRLSSSPAARLLVTPAIPANGTNSPAIRTPASTLTMTNITSEYATLPMRLGVNGMGTGYGRPLTIPNHAYVSDCQRKRL